MLGGSIRSLLQPSRYFPWLDLADEETLDPIHILSRSIRRQRLAELHARERRLPILAEKIDERLGGEFTDDRLEHPALGRAKFA